MAKSIFLLQKWGEDFLSGKGIDNPALDARVLMCYVLGWPQYKVLAERDHVPLKEQIDLFKELVKRRSNGEPIAYITGFKEFYSLDFKVNSGVLIPRPETEILVDRALNIIKGIPNPVVGDICTGSGCIAISIAVNNQNSRVYGTDISDMAIEISKENAVLHGVNGRVTFLKGDLLTPLPSNLKGSFDIIVSNPPYIPTKDIAGLDIDVRNFEPTLALDGGWEGLDYYKKIVKDVPLWLKDGGILIMEIGHNQGDSIYDILESRNYKNIKIIKDYSGLDRVAEAKLKI